MMHHAEFGLSANPCQIYPCVVQLSQLRRMQPASCTVCCTEHSSFDGRSRSWKLLMQCWRAIFSCCVWIEKYSTCSQVILVQPSAFLVSHAGDGVLCSHTLWQMIPSASLSRQSRTRALWVGGIWSEDLFTGPTHRKHTPSKTCLPEPRLWCMPARLICSKQTNSPCRQVIRAHRRRTYLQHKAHHQA